MQQAALRENILVNAEIIGTPRGLRQLFPTNRVRMTLRTIQPLKEKP